MRKVGAFKEEERAIAFVQELQRVHITALIEDDDGCFAVWVHEEGKIESARKLYETLKNEKLSPKKSAPSSIKVEQVEDEFSREKKNSDQKGQVAFNAVITRLTIIVCGFIYIMALFGTAKEKDKLPGVLAIPPIGKALIIDLPENDIIYTELIETYGKDALKKNTLPPEAEPLVKRLNTYIPWIGVYNIFLKPKKDRDILWAGERFGDVKRGQVWRLFTPAVLHLGLLHFLFNILWLSLLGKMLEFNLGRVRLVIFILLAGVFSNVCQYIMTGPYFMGISGVLSACIGYIFVRKRVAPWEVYLLGKEIIRFFLIFILGFLAIQMVAFVLEYFAIYKIPLSIANTGHISGLLFGMLLGWTGVLRRKA